jgi:hypothetical protein
MADNKGKTWVEEVSVQGNNLVERIQELLRDASATRVTICKPNGEELISLPVTIGVLIGGVLTLALPRLAAITAIGGALAQFKLKVERQEGAQTVARTQDEEDASAKS